MPPSSAELTADQAREPRRTEAQDLTRGGPQATFAAPASAPASRVLGLQRVAGNRAVASMIVQRDAQPAVPTREMDPAFWATETARVTEPYREYLSHGSVAHIATIITMARNTSYAFDADTGVLREVAVRAPEALRDHSQWRLNLSSAEATDYDGVMLAGSGPLSVADVKKVCNAMGLEFGGPRSHWVFLLLEPNLVFRHSTAGRPAQPPTRAEEPRRPVTPSSRDTKPPPWYVPADESPAARADREGANAPPLPAAVLYKPDESNAHPTVVAGAQYDFRMQVQWQFAGVLGSFESMNAAYYWELLEVTEADWRRLSGENSAATTNRASNPPVEATPVGGGKQITKARDATAAGSTEGHHYGEDARNDLREGDYTGFAGETIAGEYRILSSQFISAAVDSIEHRDQSSRRVEFPKPGYYIVRCLEGRMSSRVDHGHDRRLRAPSVAFIPVKAERAPDVAVAAASADLTKAGGHGAFERYEADLTSTRSTLDASRHLQSRFAADPTLVTRLRADPVGAASQLTVPELGVLAAADQHRLSVDELAKALGAQLKEAEGSEHKNEKTVTAWHEKLKGKTDYPLGATLVVGDTGEQVPLRLMVGQAENSNDDRPQWVVYDITSERSHDSYDGAANTHKDALLAALRTFAGENPYGYGYIGLAWPPSFGTLIPDTRDLPTLLRSAPDAKKRKEHRHSAYVDIATFLLPVAKAARALELVKAAEIFITLLGTVNAVDALKDRSRRRHLYEPSTLLELAQIAGSVKLTGKAVHYVSAAGGLVRAARVAGTSLQLLTVLELGVQVVTIPLIVREQLKAIESIASVEHKAAVLAFVLGRAIRDGVVLVRGLSHKEETEFYDDSKALDLEETERAAATKKVQPGPPTTSKRPIPPGTGTPPSGATPPLTEEEWLRAKKERGRARPYNRKPPPGSGGSSGGGRPKRTTPVRESRNLGKDPNDPRVFHTSEAQLRQAVRTRLANIMATARADPNRARHMMDYHRILADLRRTDPAFADRFDRYFMAVNDPAFIEEQIVYLWKRARDHGRTVAGELEAILGGTGGVNDFNPDASLSIQQKTQAFHDALLDPRPIVDHPLSWDFHGSHTHMFHQFLGDRLFGKGEGLKFRLDLAQKQEWDAWDVLFDSLYGPAGGLNTPEQLGKVLQNHVDFPMWDPP